MNHIIKIKRHRKNIKNESDAVAFLRDFENLHARWLPTITADIADQARLLGMTYPYTRRVLDKALWLIGKGLDKKIPKGKDKASCESVPNDFYAMLARNSDLRVATEKKFDLTKSV
ncbi:hypothetical protein DD559_05995 [Sphingomonas pokkalii]|uniref:Uncharacterized protein n=2 Tax=Sphingomonas pokkalii TaxID=2175090 RepID=A0A2U0SC35_9SPHN|nr:hypothetical protein DD559_05995 [Sphingomonas pokkalii]